MISRLTSIVIVSILFNLTSCKSQVPDVVLIRQHEAYKALDFRSKIVVEVIMRKAISSSRQKYYFKKLNLLLNTKTNPVTQTAQNNMNYIKRSINLSKQARNFVLRKTNRSLEEYLNKEELYEISKLRNWRVYQPEFFGPFFYVSDEDVNDILIHIQIHVKGNFEAIDRILSLEDAIEKHLSRPGYSVNLVLVGMKDDDVFTVSADLNKWPSSYNWSGGYMALAHELMHLMGLPDEYDKIESHAGNKNVSITQRLYQFLAQMDEELPADAQFGIMCYHSLKPLERHICASIGRGRECVKARAGK